jgi:predicted nucleic acid-binding protein
MTGPDRVVVDASVVLKCFSPHAERHSQHAYELLERWEGSRIEFFAPDLLRLEVLNVAARKWHLAAPALFVLMAGIGDLDVQWRAWDAERVAHWTEHGLSAYDAVYVAVAEAEGMPLVTDDDQIVAVAPDLAVPLRAWST